MRDEEDAILREERSSRLAILTRRRSTNTPPISTAQAVDVYVSSTLLMNFAFTPVPEPSTWALMVLAFGGAGAALRRRRALALARQLVERPGAQVNSPS